MDISEPRITLSEALVEVGLDREEMTIGEYEVAKRFWELFTRGEPE